MRLTPTGARFERVSTGLRITAMIDVIFLLLIFFMTTTTLTNPESRLTPALASEQRDAGAADLAPQIVDVALVEGEPAFRLGSRVARTRGALTAILRDLPKEQGVFVRVSGSAPVSAAAAALQACRDAGFDRVTYVPANE